MRPQVTITGIVATEPKATFVTQGARSVPKLSFRLADNSNRAEGATTEWYTIECQGNLARNGARSLKKGDSVVIFGALTITTALVTAKVIGHDLRDGTSEYSLIPVPAHQGA